MRDRKAGGPERASLNMAKQGVSQKWDRQSLYRNIRLSCCVVSPRRPVSPTRLMNFYFRKNSMSAF